MDLADRWPLVDRLDVRDALLAAYAEPGRGYHDTTHLTEVLQRLDDLGCDDEAVVLAAWFHDAVYAGAADDEERSARWAEQALDDPATAAEVGRLVRLTVDHRPSDDDVAGQLLCDADLAILAAGPERYAAYVAGVRREYAHVPEDAFRAGRAAVLEELLAMPTVFGTAYARRCWEAAARRNLGREVALLRSPG